MENDTGIPPPLHYDVPLHTPVIELDQSQLFSIDDYVDHNKMYCDLCRLKCHDIRHWTTHLKGKTHLTQVKIRNNEPNDLYCMICKVQCSRTGTYKAHLNSRAHKEKLQELQIIGVESVYNVKIDRDNVAKPNAVCPDCGITFRKHEQFVEHVKAVHVSTFPDSNDMSFKCRTCDAHFATTRYLIKHLTETVRHAVASQPADIDLSQIRHTNVNDKSSAIQVESVQTDFRKDYRTGDESSNSDDQNAAYGYKCKYCAFRETNFRQLMDHEHKCHDKERRYCVKCEKLFNTRQKYKYHEKKVHPTARVECSKCNKTFKTRGQLADHSVIHEGLRFACQLCDADFAYPRALKQHFKSAHEGNKKRPDAARQRTSKPRRHAPLFTTAHNDHIIPNIFQDFEDLIDRPAIDGEQMLQMPAETMSTDETASSSPRPLDFSTITLPVDDGFDEPSASTERQHCGKCPYSFRSELALRRHLYAVHAIGSPIESKFICEQCGKKMATNQTLQRHMLNRHTENRQKIPCSLCQKEFATKSALDVHIKALHSNRKDYKCTTCDVAFAQRSGLYRHMQKKHGEFDEQRYKCDYCPFTSGVKGSVKRHMLTHAARKQHTCHLCSFSAHQKSNLDHHINTTHLKALRVNCRFCNKKCPDEQTRDRHERSAHFMT